MADSKEMEKQTLKNVQMEIEQVKDRDIFKVSGVDLLTTT